jgi:hypothetical protein
MGLLVRDLRLEMCPGCALGLELGAQRGKIGDIIGGGHGGRLPEPDAQTTKNTEESAPWRYAAVSGGRTRRGVTRRQSSPSNKASNCPRVSRITPSFTAGQAKHPSSSRL